VVGKALGLEQFAVLFRKSLQVIKGYLESQCKVTTGYPPHYEAYRTGDLPPSIFIEVPVTYDAASETRNAMTLAASSA